MMCGIRGDRGVCSMPHDHTGECETNHGHSIRFTDQQKKDNRFQQILKDLSFLLLYMTEPHGRVPEKS